MSIQIKLVFQFVLSAALITALAVFSFLFMQREQSTSERALVLGSISYKTLGAQSTFLEVGSQMFRAFQHNPDFEYAQLHDHPTTQHTQSITKLLGDFDSAINESVALVESLPSDDKLRSSYLEKILAIQKKHDAFRRTLVEPTLERLHAGDFSTTSVSRFLKGNREFERQIVPALSELNASIRNDVQQARNVFVSNFSQVKIVLPAAVLGLIILLFFTSHFIARSIKMKLLAIERAAAAVATGDYTVRIEARGNDELSRIGGFFNDVLTNTSSMLREIKTSSQNVINQCLDAASITTEASRSSRASMDASSSIAATMEEVSVNIGMVNESSSEALSHAQSAASYVTESGRLIEASVSKIRAIESATHGASKGVEELERGVNEISAVVSVIRDVAEQTNLLALNAAIEAARAGEQGRGFAVVADEVRKLAERTQNSTTQINKMIETLNERTHVVVGSVANVASQLNQSIEEAKQIEAHVSEIESRSNSVKNSINQISNAMQEQNAAAQDVARKIEGISQSSESGYFDADRSSKSSAQAVETAQQMLELISRIRT